MYFLQPEKKTGTAWDSEILTIMNSVKKQLITTFDVYQCRNFILWGLVNLIVIHICSINLKKFNYRIYTPRPHIAGLPALYRFVSSSTDVAKLDPIETRSSIRHKLSLLILCLYRASIYFEHPKSVLPPFISTEILKRNQINAIKRDNSLTIPIKMSLIIFIMFQ